MATCVENVAEHPPATSKEGEELWKRKYQVLKRKCQEFEQVNEVLFAKAKRIHLMIERAEAEKRFLIKRLDQFEVVEFPMVKSEVKREKVIPPPPPALLGPFPPPTSQTHSAPSTPGTGDERSPDAPLTIVTNEHIPESVPILSKPPPLQPSAPSKSKGKQSSITSASTPKSRSKPKTNVASSSFTKTSAAVKSSTKQRKTIKTVTSEKQKGDSVKKSAVSKRKKDVDPNAPKKPSNSFFWFCQEHRPGLQEHYRGEGVTGQHDLTKVLAKMWSEITPEEKKKYYNFYAEDKKRYEREMQEYAAKNQVTIPVTETPPE